MKLMSEILIVWYSSFREVNVIIGNMVVQNIDTVNRIQRKQRQNIEEIIDKIHPKGVENFDGIDETYLNFYRKPEQKLDALYQDIEVNNDKKS